MPTISCSGRFFSSKIFKFQACKNTSPIEHGYRVGIRFFGSARPGPFRYWKQQNSQHSRAPSSFFAEMQGWEKTSPIEHMVIVCDCLFLALGDQGPFRRPPSSKSIKSLPGSWLLQVCFSGGRISREFARIGGKSLRKAFKTLFLINFRWENVNFLLENATFHSFSFKPLILCWRRLP